MSIETRLKKLEEQEPNLQAGEVSPVIAEFIERLRAARPEGERVPVPEPEPHEYEHPAVKEMIAQGITPIIAVHLNRLRLDREVTA